MITTAYMHARVQKLLDEIRAEQPDITDGWLTIEFLDRADEDLKNFFIKQIADEINHHGNA
jgi:hypothetical protein